MIYEIDQSGKIEDTSRNTVIAFSNSKSGWITIDIEYKGREDLIKSYLIQLHRKKK